MRRPVNLTLVRHGETTLNVAKVIQGHTDATLSKDGENQAELLGKHIADHKFTRVYSSDLCRAHNTAEMIMKHSKHPNHVKIAKDARLRERCYGELEGQHFTVLFEAAERHGTTGMLYTPKGGETPEQAIDRIREFFMELCKLADTDYDESVIPNDDQEENILLVSHGGILHLLMKFLYNSKDSFNLQHFEPSKALQIFSNTGLTRMKISPLVPDGEEARQKRTITFSTFNNISHLNSKVSPSWDTVAV